MKFVKGYQLLTLGWSDGATFIPVNFSLVGYAKHLIEGMNIESISERVAIKDDRNV